MFLTTILGFLIAVGGCQLSGPYLGVYQGGDSSYPWTASDAWNQLASMLNPWTTFSLSSGYYSADNSSWFLPLARAVGIQATHRPELVQRLEIISIVALAGLSMYFLVRSYNLDRFSAVITGLIYSFSPVMFNYIVMGWNNLTLAFASVPLVVLILRHLNKSEQKKSIKKFSVGILAGILFSGSAALVSLFLVVFLSWHPERCKTRKTMRMRVQGVFALFSGFLFINAFWIVPRLIYSPLDDASGLSSLVDSKISIGARDLFSFSSLLTGEYSQFNNSFFVAFPIILKSLLVGLPLLAVMALFVQHQQTDKNLFKRLIVLWIIFAILSLSSLLVRIGPLGLLFGREPARIYALGFFCTALLASFYISSIPKSQTAPTYAKQILVSLFLVAQISPFLLGKLESSVLPAQPALTLRPAVISDEFPEIYNKIMENSSGDSSVLVVPGSPNYRVMDERSRFEPPFNMVAGVGMHLPLPATWAATDKIPLTLKNTINGRGAKIVSGNVSDLSDLMIRENSTMVLVDVFGTTPGDLIAIEMILNSGKFLELTEKSPKGMNPRRFRLFKSLIPRSADRKSYVPINFLDSSQNPIGSTTVFCRTRTEILTNGPIQFSTPFTFSNYWTVTVRSSQTNGKCSSGSSSMTKLPAQISSVDGLLNVAITQIGADDFFEVDMSFRPARLQEHIIIITISLSILLLFAVFSNFLRRKQGSFRWPTASKS